MSKNKIERRYGVPCYDTYLVYGPPNGSQFKNEEESSIAKRLKMGDIVENVKVVDDNSYLNRIIANQNCHLEFNIVGENITRTTNYPWYLFANTKENQARLNRIIKIREEQEELQNELNLILDKALDSSYNEYY